MNAFQQLVNTLLQRFQLAGVKTTEASSIGDAATDVGGNFADLGADRLDRFQRVAESVVEDGDRTD